MLSRCTAKLLTGKGGDEALEAACLGLYLGRTRKHAEASMRGALETLDGLMRRSDDGSAEGAVWAQALRSKRRSGLMVRWLLCRESVEPLRAALRPSDDDKWRKLAALEAAAEALLDEAPQRSGRRARARRRQRRAVRTDGDHADARRTPPVEQPVHNAGDVAARAGVMTRAARRARAREAPARREVAVELDAHGVPGVRFGHDELESDVAERK